MDNDRILHPGIKWGISILWVNDVKAAALFYQKAFSFSLAHIYPIIQDDMLHFARMCYRDFNVAIMHKDAFGQEAETPSIRDVPMNPLFYVYVPVIDDLFSTAVANGATVLQKIRKENWGDLKCRLQDPEGYVWDFAQSIE